MIALLHEKAARAMRASDLREGMVANGAVPAGSAPEEFAGFIQSEIVKWAKVVEQSRAVAE